MACFVALWCVVVRYSYFCVFFIYRSSSPTEETFHETGEFMEACSSAIKNHKLFPIVEVGFFLISNHLKFSNNIDSNNNEK